ARLWVPGRRRKTPLSRQARAPLSHRCGTGPAVVPPGCAAPIGMANMVDIAQGTLVASEKAKLRKVLRRFDLVLFAACAIVGLDSVAFAAEAGAQAITWLLISLVIFLIPYGMLVAELGTAFPV